MHKKPFFIIAVIVAVLFVLAGAMLYKENIVSGRTSLVLQAGTANETSFKLENASDSVDQTKGLSGRTGLGKNSGMIFVYEDQSQHCIWMKDMNFSIDVVWFDENKRISSIVSNMSPDSYPQSYCAESKYIIELPAGTTARYGLRVGQTIPF